MTKLILFLFIISNIIAIDIKDYEGLKELFLRGSSQVELNKLEIESIELVEEKRVYEEWKGLSLSLNPVFIEKKDGQKQNDLQIEVDYRNFYLKTFYNDSLDISLSESDSLILGYENSVGNILGTDSRIEKEIVKLKGNKVILENKIRNINAIGNLFREVEVYLKIELELALLKKGIKENNTEITIANKLFDIGESSEYELAFILGESKFLKKQLENLISKKENQLGKVEKVLNKEGVNLDYFDYTKVTSYIPLKKNLSSSLKEIEIELIEKQKELNSYNILDNIFINGEYDIESQTSLAQVKFVYKPFEKDYLGMNYDIELEKLEIRKNDIVEEESYSYESTLLNLKGLDNEVKKYKSEYELYSRKFDYIANLYSKGGISYYIYLEEKKKVEEAERRYRLKEIEYYIELAINLV